MKFKFRVAAFILFSCVSAMAQSQQSQPGEATGFREDEYVLGPEDVIEVFVWKEPDLSTTVMVRPDGKISLPLISQIQASGKTATQLQQEISEGLRQYVDNAVVNVVIREVNSPKISVLGEVHKPDRYKIRHKVTVLDAIALAGGFTEFAKQNEVLVIRNGPTGLQKIRLNLKRLLKEGTGEPFYLRPSDTVYVQ
ncbi:MAG TPA: polysaccharide biosynthesis/export family protein [Acidobacteriota bacterium]|jgi:polysaccharide export outer membrane protein